MYKQSILNKLSDYRAMSNGYAIPPINEPINYVPSSMLLPEDAARKWENECLRKRDIRANLRIGNAPINNIKVDLPNTIASISNFRNMYDPIIKDRLTRKYYKRNNAMPSLPDEEAVEIASKPAKSTRKKKTKKAAFDILCKVAEELYHKLPIPDTIESEKVPAGRLLDALKKRVADAKKKLDKSTAKLPIALQD